jgi:hypothetical protein
MDTIINSLPSHVSDLLMSNFTIVEIVAMFSIGAYNALEVVMSLFEGFKKYRGLYFWSMQVAAWGILVHAIAAQIRFMSRASNLSMTIPFIIGWMCMVSGQAVVLYSRLHLVVHDVRHIRWVLWMIIASFFILHTPMTALFFCLNLGDTRCARPAAIFDRLQVTGFGIQDTIICAIYIREAIHALKPIFAIKGREGRRTIYWLLVVNLLGIILNVCIIVAEFRLHYIAISFKTVAYSIKLKLEFYALTQLRELTRTYPCTMCQGMEGNARVSSDVNIFDMLSSRPQPTDVEVQPVPSFVGTISPPPHSTRSSTYDFHEALRERVSVETSVHSHGGTRPPIRSSDTRSTVEISLLETPK